jgi:glycosyltransferase involved in cell wall biosynthesis
MKIAFVAQDDLSAVIFSGWYARQFATRSDIELSTVCSLGTHSQELSELGCRQITVKGYRFVHPYRDLKYFASLLRVFRRERFDMVVTFGTKPNIYGALAARLAGVPRVVVAVRGLGRAFSGGSRSLHRLLRAVIRCQYRLSCGGASRVWFTNRGDFDYFVQAGLVDRTKCFVTTNGVSLDYFSMGRVDPNSLDALRRELSIRKGAFVVIMVARLVWSKGIREFIGAAEILRLTHPDIRFVLVAPAEHGADAISEDYVSDACRPPNVTWLKFRKDVRELYALADLAVLPSYYKEGGYPRALLEPMALGKPVIAADTDECRGPVEDCKNGYLVPPRDAVALARRIEDLYRDDDKRRRFGMRSLEIMRTRFDEAIIGAQVLSELGISG